MRPGSIRLRLLLAGAGAVSLALLLSTWGLVALFARHIERVAVSDLSDRLEHLAATVEAGPDGEPVLEEPPRDPVYQQPYSGHYWQIEMNGRQIRSRSLWDFVLPLPEPQEGMTWQSNILGPSGETLFALERQLRLQTPGGEVPLRIAVAIDRTEIDQIRSDFLADLLPYTALLAIVLIGAGAVQVTVGLRPLSTLGLRVAALNSGQAQRIGRDVPAEVLPLAMELDSLLKTREAELDRARLRAGDLAHGLKTPLQALLGEASRIRSQGALEAAAGIEEIVWTMQEHVDRELTRAWLAAGTGSAVSDLVATARAVAEVLRRTPRGEEIEIKVEGPSGLAVRLDRAELTEALGALAENAVRHARGRVAITCARIGDRVSVRVTDDGLGVEEMMLEAITDRGVRLDERTDGAGLGLAIASDICRAAGGTMTLQNLKPGFEAELQFPSPARA